MADRDGQGREARPEDEFIEGVTLAVHRRTGQWPWMDQVEDDFLPLLRKYKAAVTKAHDAEVAAAARLDEQVRMKAWLENHAEELVREAADRIARADGSNPR